MAASKTLNFDVVDGQWKLRDTVDYDVHKWVMEKLYGVPRCFHKGEDTQLMIDVFEAFGFTLVFNQ